MSEHQCDVNTKLLQGCTVHLTNMCKPLAGTTKTQPSIPEKKKNKSQKDTHAHLPAHPRTGTAIPGDPCQNLHCHPIIENPKVCQFVITSTHTHSSLGISMSGTAAKMTAENLGELLGLFADYLLQWRLGKKTNGARGREVGRETAETPAEEREMGEERQKEEPSETM